MRKKPEAVRMRFTSPRPAKEVDEFFTRCYRRLGAAAWPKFEKGDDEMQHMMILMDRVTKYLAEE